jgi:hypothetical protein
MLCDQFGESEDADGHEIILDECVRTCLYWICPLIHLHMRHNEPVAKTHINLTVEHDLWLRYKAACEKRDPKVVVGKRLEDIMRKDLERWQKEDESK